MLIVVALAAIGFAALLRFAAGELWSSALLVLALALLSAAALRVTARRLLAAVAAVVIIVGGGIGTNALWQRCSTARNLAAWHAQQAASYARAARQSAAIAQATRDGTRPVGPMIPPDDPDDLDAEIRRRVEIEVVAHERRAAEQRQLAAYHAQISREYLRAASHPWESVTVKPPGP
jgi:hypothetical protein